MVCLGVQLYWIGAKLGFWMAFSSESFSFGVSHQNNLPKAIQIIVKTAPVPYRRRLLKTSLVTDKLLISTCCPWFLWQSQLNIWFSLTRCSQGLIVCLQQEGAEREGLAKHGLGAAAGLMVILVPLWSHVFRKCFQSSGPHECPRTISLLSASLPQLISAPRRTQLPPPPSGLSRRNTTLLNVQICSSVMQNEQLSALALIVSSTVYIFLGKIPYSVHRSPLIKPLGLSSFQSRKHWYSPLARMARAMEHSGFHYWKHATVCVSC